MRTLFGVNGSRLIVMGRPYSALEVGCTGKALFGVSSRSVARSVALGHKVRVRDGFSSKANYA